MKRVLFIQHAGVPGGSVKTLRRFLLSLRETDYEATLCLLNPAPEVVEYYRVCDIPTVITRQILPFPHTSASWLHAGDLITAYGCVKGMLYWRRSERETRRIITENPCDLVHLNSSILLPSAFALHNLDQRFVWHVREAPQPRYFGNRLRLFRKCLTEFPTERVFLSESDRSGWLGRNDLGIVIRHSVEEYLFGLDCETGDAKTRLGIPSKTKCLLYVGGFARIKGIYVLLEALQRLLELGESFVCLMPFTERVRGTSFRSRAGRTVLKITSGGTDEMRALAMIQAWKLEKYIRRMPYQEDLRELLQAADILVFPAIVPHFAVPVIEAGAAGKPVIASDYAAMRELVEDQKTGILVEPDNASALADAIMSLWADEARQNQMGKAARIRAFEHHAPGAEVEAFVRAYDRALSGK